MFKIDLTQKKNLFIVICISILLIAAIVLAVIVMPNNEKNKTTSGDDSSLNTQVATTITAAGQVGNNVCVVTGYCSEDTNKIIVSGDNVITTESKPFAGKGKKYFIP